MTDHPPRSPWLPAALKLAPSIILAAGLALGGYFLGGRYEIVRQTDDNFMVIDRLTGDVEACRANGFGCWKAR